MRFLSVLVLLAGCGFLDASGRPEVLAHRAGAGHWPENSRTAIEGSLAAAYAGIEVDVVLTSDGIPVLSHDPWLNEELCTLADGSRLSEHILIKDLSLAALQENYLCGGLPDPDMPEAEVVADVHVTLEEMLERLGGHPEVSVVLDVKFEPGETPSAGRMASAILERWNAADLPNRLWVSADLPEALEAFEAADSTVQTVLVWPRIPPGESETGAAVAAEAGLVFGWSHPLSTVRKVGADGLSMPYEVVDRMVVEEARSDGLDVLVWTLNDDEALGRYCEWPLDGLVSDYPERAPCR